MIIQSQAENGQKDTNHRKFSNCYRILDISDGVINITACTDSQLIPKCTTVDNVIHQSSLIKKACALSVWVSCTMLKASHMATTILHTNFLPNHILFIESCYFEFYTEPTSYDEFQQVSLFLLSCTVHCEILQQSPCLLGLGFTQTMGRGLKYVCLNYPLATVNVLYCVSFSSLQLPCHFQVPFTF